MNFPSSQYNFDYTPARLVKSQKNWYITWYERNLDTDVQYRFRKSFGLALIKNKRDRYRHAKIHIARINKDLSAGIFTVLNKKWKDTGDQKLARSGIDILSIRDHNRHKSLATTNVYLQNTNLRDPQITRLDYTIIPGI